MSSPAGTEGDRPQRVTVYPREAAALDRLLDAYLVTDEGDPGLADLARLRQRVRRLRQDHGVYETRTSGAADVTDSCSSESRGDEPTVEADRDSPGPSDAADGVTHLLPHDGVLPCCGEGIYGVPRTDRMSADSARVTCQGPCTEDRTCGALRHEDDCPAAAGTGHA